MGAAALALLALAAPVASSADELARDANLALVASLADTATTRYGVDRRCMREADPLARPFQHSDLEGYATTLVVNGLLRVVFRHAPKALRIVTGVELAATANNAALDLGPRCHP